MNFDKKSLLLYAVTDRTWTDEVSLLEQVEQALRAGVTMVQLREKNMNKEQFLEEAIQMRRLTKKYQVPLIINDDMDIAIQSGADGVHVGQDDMDATMARALIGPNRILGVSVHSVKEATIAWKQGADYLGVGAVFNTATKHNVTSMPYHTLKNICQSVYIPVVAIGGIQLSNIQKLKGSGIQGVAVVSAIFGSKSIDEATKQLHHSVSNIVYEEAM